jgi:carboxyl-terminal processing protease
MERKARHSIALNEAKFKAEYAPDDDEKEHADEEKAKKDKRKKKYTEREVWSNDFYNDEVVRIVNDYLTLGSSKLAANPVKAAAAE